MGKMKGAKKIKQPQADNSRKAQRKQKRLQKKVHRQEHYLKKKTVQEQAKYTAGRFVKRPADDIKPEKIIKKKKPKLQPSAQDMLSIERDKELKEANKLKSEMDERRRDIFLKANEDEDKLIKKLEKQLGLNKSKNKNNYFADDGLDYLLEICDKSTTEQIVAAEKHLAEVEGDSDFDEDLAAVTGKETTKSDRKRKRKNHVDDDETSDDVSGQEVSEDEKIIKTDRKRKRKGGESDDDEIGGDSDEISDEDEDDLGQQFSDDEELSESQSDEDGEISSNDDDENISDLDKNSEESEPEEKPTKPQKHESKKLETKSNKTTSKLKTESKTKAKEKIIKADELSKVFSDDEISHLSGDDDDLEGFSGDEKVDNDDSNHKKEKPDVWEDIYGRKRDKEGNIIKEEKGVYIPPHLRNKDSTSDKQLAQLKRQIKSVLNKLAGTNLHWACTSIENLYSNNSRNSVNTALTQLWLEATVGPSVTPDRLVTEHAALVSVLHANVGSEIGAHFLQELVKRFDSMMEAPPPLEDKSLENLVACLAHFYNFKIFDSPLMHDILTRIVATLTEKTVDCALAALRCCGATLRKLAPRQLQELVRDVQARAAGLSEGATSGSRIKFLLEVLMAIKNNNLMKIPNYDPSYQEHLKKTTKTIVRKGNYITPLNIRLEDLLKADERGKWWVVGSAWEGSAARDEERATEPTAAPNHDQKLLELARQQRMNTDVRRSIFCVIMAAEDYMDAFEKLQHLGLRAQQEREVVHVLLACCLREASYNPYYGVLANKLCSTDRRYQLSVQFAVWDKIKDIENQPKQSLANLAQFLTHLIMEKGLPLSVLKVIQFSELSKRSVRLMRRVLLALMMHEGAAALDVFRRIAKPPKLHMFRESLRLFIQHFLVKNAGKQSGEAAQVEALRRRAAEVSAILSASDSKLQF